MFGLWSVSFEFGLGPVRIF